MFIVTILLMCIQTVFTKDLRTNFIENIRAKHSIHMIKETPCVQLIGEKNCSDIKNKLPHQMQFFMASKQTSSLRIVKLKGTKVFMMDVGTLDAVVVVDPFPEAHYGHTTIVFAIKAGITKEACDKIKGVHYSAVDDSKDECMFLPNFRKCHVYKNMLQGDVSECLFKSIPRVDDATDGTNRLKCYPEIEGFGPCPIVKFKKNHKCANKRNCQTTTSSGIGACHSKCDYALMLSGGWNKFINKIRHLRNLQDMYQYLTVKKSFPKDNIKVFFANNSTIELDGDKSTQDAVPATHGKTILNGIKSVCRKASTCIDTFVLYLNGPTLPNGNILLWDKNKDGMAEENEIITVSDLISSFHDCTAKNILIIADQNFAEHIIDEVNSQKKMGYGKTMKTVSVVTASSRRSYTWGRDFTTKFIEYDNVYIDSATDTSPSRRISTIFHDLKKQLSSEYKIRYLPNDDADLTVTGTYGTTAGCRANLDALNIQWGKPEKREKRSVLRVSNIELSPGT